MFAMSEDQRDDYAKRLHKSVREVYRDDVLWVLDKPSGIVSHPNSPTKRSANALLRVDYDGETESYTFGRRQVFLVHRLDQDTSGLILCTFSGDAAATLKEDLYHRELEKEYRALVLSAPRPPFGEWRDRLVKESKRGRVEVRTKSRGDVNAETSYELERSFPGTGLALLRLRPHTGRTHQLRVQASRRDVPIIGDDRYGDFTANRFLREKIGLKYMFLHAARVELRHPTKGKRMTFTAPFSKRLTEPLEKLEMLYTRVPTREREEPQDQPKAGRSQPHRHQSGRPRSGRARSGQDQSDQPQSNRRGRRRRR
jgi:RluA family pseudouridine synthase